MDFTLRYAMIHMIQETARHCGHLDLLRETTDGAVGHVMSVCFAQAGS